MPKKSVAEKEKKRRIVAKAAIAGKGTKITARAAGCSQRQVQRLLKEPETQYLITKAMKPHQGTLTAMVARMITTVNAGMRAKKTDTADHIARLRAVERAEHLLELAQGKPSADMEQQGPALVTWEEYLVLYQKRSVEHGNPDQTDAPEVG